MLDKFKKLLGTEQKPAKETLTVKIDASDVQAELETLRAEVTAELEAYKTEANALLAQAEASAAELVAQLAEANTKYEEAQAALVAIEAEKVAAVAQAAVVKLAARKEKVVAAIGTEKAEGLMLATEGLEDAQFEAVVSALAGSIDAEAKTALFTESGVTADVDATQIAEESGTMKFLKQQYNIN